MSETLIDRLCGCGYREVLHKVDSQGSVYCQLAKARALCRQAEHERDAERRLRAVDAAHHMDAEQAGRQAGLEEAAKIAEMQPRIVPSDLDPDELFNRNGEYVYLDDLLDVLRARAAEGGR